MKNLILTLCIILMPMFVFSQSYSTTETQTRCITLGNEKAAAINAKDFKNLRSINKWGIEYCKPYLKRDSYYQLYGDLALAERELGNFQAAMKAADDCIKNRYGLPQCHLEKFVIYKYLGNSKEANESAQTFKIIVTDAIKNKKSDLSNSYLNGDERSLIETEIKLLESMRNFAERSSNSQ